MPVRYCMMVRLTVATTALVLLTSCQTTEPIWFIATPGYVDTQLAVREEAIRADYERQIADLESELESQRAVADELSGLAGVIREVESSNRELQELAAVVEDELDRIPEETIQLIVDVLTRHLSGGVAPD